MIKNTVESPIIKTLHEIKLNDRDLLVFLREVHGVDLFDKALDIKYNLGNEHPISIRWEEL